MRQKDSFPKFPFINWHPVNAKLPFETMPDDNLVGRVKRSGPDKSSTHVGSDYRLEPTYGETKFLGLRSDVSSSCEKSRAARIEKKPM